MTILSVLMPAIPQRSHLFTPLYNELHRQLEFMNTFHPSLGEIEIIVDPSKKFLDGGLSIGKKRESLVKKATGRYCNFLDDDENIAPNYLETLVRLCCQGKDVCTFRSLAKLDNYWAIYDMSLLNGENQQSTPDGIVKRLPFHTCPVRTEYAQRYDFYNISYGEDWQWMEKVLGDCTTEAHSEKIILQYNHGDFSESDRITKFQNENKAIS